MDEQKALEIGIAYGLYKSICSVSGLEASLNPTDFCRLCLDSIQEIRISSGLVPEDSITG